MGQDLVSWIFDLRSYGSSNRGLFSNHYDANEAGGHRKSSGVVGRSREGSSEHKGRTFELLLYNSQT